MEDNSDCTNNCINIDLDNNNRSRFLVLSRKGGVLTEFYFKDKEIYSQPKENEPSIKTLPGDDKPKYLFQRKEELKDMYVYSQKKRWYILGRYGNFEETAEKPDAYYCCVPR